MCKIDGNLMRLFLMQECNALGVESVPVKLLEALEKAVERMNQVEGHDPD